MLSNICISANLTGEKWYLNGHFSYNERDWPLLYICCSYCFSHLVLSNSTTPWIAWGCRTGISQSLLKFMSIESVMPSNHLILCHRLLLLSSIFPSTRGFSKKSALCIRRPKYWSFSFSIGPSKEYSGLISFRTDWLDLLAVQGTLKSLLQHHSLKQSILRHSAFFIYVVALYILFLPICCSYSGHVSVELFQLVTS